MKQSRKSVISVKGTEITILSQENQDFISLSDMVKGFDGGSALIEQWLRNKDTIEFLAVWEQINNNDFNSLEFEGIRKDSGTNRFYLSVKKWISKTNAIKENLIPDKLLENQINYIYATEADVLNMALFGKTAKQWRCSNSNKKGNIRDYAEIFQLICLSNLENMNAHFINEGISQSGRLMKLNKIAIQQMKLLVGDARINQMIKKTLK